MYVMLASPAFSVVGALLPTLRVVITGEWGDLMCIVSLCHKESGFASTHAKMACMRKVTSLE